MVTLGIALACLGVLIEFGSFLYALSNMAGYAKNFFGQGPRDFEFDFGNMFQKHIGAMGAMAGGGLLMVVGIALAVFGNLGG